MTNIKKRYEDQKKGKENDLKRNKESMEKKQAKEFIICSLALIIWLFGWIFYIYISENYTHLIVGLCGAIALVPTWIIAFISSAKNEDNKSSDCDTLMWYASDLEDIIEDAISDETVYKAEAEKLKKEIQRISNDSVLAKTNKLLREDNIRLIDEKNQAKSDANNYKEKIKTLFRTDYLNYSGKSISDAVRIYVDTIIDKGWLFMFYPYFYATDEDYRNIINNNAEKWTVEIINDVNGNRLDKIIEMQKEAGLVPYKKSSLQSGKKNSSTDIKELERVRKNSRQTTRNMSGMDLDEP